MSRAWIKKSIFTAPEPPWGYDLLRHTRFFIYDIEFITTLTKTEWDRWKKNHMMRRFSNYAYNSVNSNAINHRKKSFKTSNFPWLGCMCFSAFLRAMCCRAHRTRNWDFSFISHRRQPFCVSKRIIELHFNSILHIINPPPAWANIGHMLRLPLNLQNALYRLSWEIST